MFIPEVHSTLETTTTMLEVLIQFLLCPVVSTTKYEKKTEGSKTL